MPAASSSPSIVRLELETSKIGCPELIGLDEPPTAQHLNYLDLMWGRSTAALRPQAVAEFQGRPLLYLIDNLNSDAQRGQSDEQVRDLSQLLANRSEHAMLGIVRPGELTLYPVNLDRAALAAALPAVLSLTTPEAPLFFQRLATGSFTLDGQAIAPDYVFNEIHRLLTEADTELSDQLSPLEVLSVTGRALFFRFLRDRKIVLRSELSEICPKADDLRDVFADADCAAATCCWLDETFNGDLLPLINELDSRSGTEARLRAYGQFFSKADKKTNGNIFRHLEAIMRGWKHFGRSEFQTTIDWDDFDFAHIPIGVLSQVYETFSRRWDEVGAEQTGVYYTPKNIARLVVEEALAGVKEPHDAVILDPACGAGTFLVLAFRHLVRLRWQKEGQRPDKNVIQRILYKQIRGFDVSESALRLAALALYITAIEINGTTRPPKILKFPRALKDEVLFNFSDIDERRHGFALGSLGPNVPERFNGYFDAVVGNPPWTSLRTRAKTSAKKAEERARNRAMNREFTAITRRVLATRNIDGLNVEAYENPDNNPDLPFLWRAVEWTKPGGMIAMALPARIILKQSGAGQAAREAILRGLTVTGILNGSDLEKTPVWSSTDLPFMLLFAQNLRPSPQHQFQFVAPLREESLCERAEFRIDYRSAQAVSVESVVKKPWMLKTLSIGSALDVEVLQKMSECGYSTIAEIWAHNELLSSTGYIIAPEWPQQPADHLLDLPDFEPSKGRFGIEFHQLQSWRKNHDRVTAHAPRDAALYEPPLVIIPQTPGASRDRPKAYLSAGRRVAFSQSFYGYSTAGHRDAKGLARLLYLVTHSLLWQHYYLTHSSRIGASYRTFVKEDLDGLPLPNPGAMTGALRHRVETLVEQMLTCSDAPPKTLWDQLDDLVFALYELTPHDAAIVRDTVRFGAPYRSSRRPAARPPEQPVVDEFCKYLENMIEPFLKEVVRGVHIAPLPAPNGTWNPPWRFIAATLNGPAEISSALLSKIMQEANRTAASRVIMLLPQGGLLIGLLNQLRFWSESRARLCGLHIVRQHLSAFRRK
jgi:hypothetical protein